MGTPDPSISVIIPFFNAERHIEECVHSLMRQTVKDGIEFIFVNDGSTDSSEPLIEKTVSLYAGRKPQTRIIRNPENRGSAYSRERGMAEAKGKFLIHCDADDWVDPAMFGDMLSEAERENADVVCVPFLIETPKRTIAQRFKRSSFPSLNDAPIDTLHFSLWNKLIRREVLDNNDIHIFPGIDCWEDVGITFRVFACTDKIRLLDRPYYHYRRNQEQTLTTSRMEKVLSDHLRFAEEMERWFDRQPPQLREQYAPFIRNIRFTAKIKMLRGKKRDLNRWKSTYPETNRRIFRYKHIPLPYRLAFFLAENLPEKLVKGAFALSSRFSRPDRI